MTRILDIDRFSGITETFKKDGNKIIINKHQDVEKIFDANNAEKNLEANTSWKGDFHKVASIPMILIEQWREELKAKGVSDPNPLAACNRNFLIAKINSGDYSKIRTKGGRV